MLWSISAAFAYYYTAVTWNNSILMANFIPTFVISIILAGGFSQKCYVAYSLYFMLSSALTCQLPGALSAGHISLPILTFVYLQFFVLFNWLKTRFSARDFELGCFRLKVFCVPRCFDES